MTEPTTPRDKPLTSDTRHTASRRAYYWFVPLVVAALAVTLVGMHFLSGTK